MRSKDFLKSLIAFGCDEISVSGSHHKVVYPTTGKVAPVPVHGGEDMNRGFLADILKQLGIDTDEFLEFIKRG